MSTTINPATTEASNSITTAPLSKAKAATEGLASSITDDSTASGDSFSSALEKLVDENAVAEEGLMESTNGNVFPTTGKIAETVAENDRSVLIPGLNAEGVIQNTNAVQAMVSEQPLIADHNVNEVGVKLAPDAGLLSSSKPQSMQIEGKEQGQKPLNSSSISSELANTAASLLRQDTLNGSASINGATIGNLTEGLVNRHGESALFSLDSTTLTTQKNLLTSSLLNAQLAAMSSPQKDSQTGNLSLESNSNPLSALLSPSSGSVSSSSMSTQPQLSIGERFGQPAWAQGMARQIVWMANQNINSAELRLNPAHLGSIEVRIDMRDEMITVALNSRHAVVREAMETSLPRLREMLDENGMSLADADISQQSFAEQREQNTSDSQGNIISSGSEGNDFINLDEAALHQPTISTAMVDYYI